jgi:hypothetical protein
MKKPLVFALLLSAAAYGMAQDALLPNGGAIVQQAVHHDISRPLRDIAPIPPKFGPPREVPIHLFPVRDGLAEGQMDPVAQKAPGILVPAPIVNSFDGVGIPNYAVNAAPPDTNGAVGATQYVQWVNEAFAVFDKATGATLYGPANGNTLWSGFGGPCEADNDGDPIAQYDKINGRWIMTQFAVSAQPYLQCVAVSTTSDATGSFARYSFSYGNGFNDYPKLGVWPDAYYVSFNIFQNGSSFIGAKVCAYDGASMRAGAAATQQCFQLSSSFPSLLPGDWDGPTLPAPGAPDVFLNFGTNSLNLWKFHVDWTTPSNSTLTGPIAVSGVAAFSPACSGGACIPQSGTREKLDSLGDRLMYRLAYSNIGGQESLVVNHSVKVSGNKHSQVDGVRWYEIRNFSGSSPSVFQQGTFSPDSSSRWMGSIARDKVGDIAVGYSVSSGGIHPSIRYTGRVPTDPAGTLQAEGDITDGSGSQLQNLNRWGDYSALAIDPVDGCTMWYTTEYLKTNGTFNWSTRIANFKFPGCQ